MCTPTFVPPFGRRSQWIVVTFPITVLFLLWSWSVYRYDTWDWLLISGWATFILAILLSNRLPSALEHCLKRLIHRGALCVSEIRLTGFTTELECARVPKYAIWFGGAVATGIIIAFLGAYNLHQLIFRIPLLVGEAVGSYVAGCYLGRMVCYGRLEAFMKFSGFDLRVIPAHPDTAGGFKPIGDFFFFQASIAGLPALFLAVWLILISFDLFPVVEQYKQWTGPYAGLLVLAVAIEMMAFIWPLWGVHCQMQTQKKALLKEADALSVEITVIQSNLAGDADPTIRDRLKSELSYKLERWRALEELPVWPIDQKTKRRFAVNNIILLLPAIGQYTGLSQQAAEHLKHLIGIFTG